MVPRQWCLGPVGMFPGPLAAHRQAQAERAVHQRGLRRAMLLIVVVPAAQVLMWQRRQVAM